MGRQRVLPVINLFFFTKDTFQFIFKMEKRKKKSSIRGGTPNGKYIRIIFHFLEPFPYKQCSLKWPNLGTMATEIEIVNRFDE